MLGRRKELMFSALLYILGALVTAVAPVFAVLVIGRLIFGLGIGLVRCIMDFVEFLSLFVEIFMYVV